MITSHKIKWNKNHDFDKSEITKIETHWIVCFFILPTRHNVKLKVWLGDRVQKSLKVRKRKGSGYEATNTAEKLLLLFQNMAKKLSVLKLRVSKVVSNFAHTSQLFCLELMAPPPPSPEMTHIHVLRKNMKLIKMSQQYKLIGLIRGLKKTSLPLASGLAAHIC